MPSTGRGGCLHGSTIAQNPHASSIYTPIPQFMRPSIHAQSGDLGPTRSLNPPRLATFDFIPSKMAQNKTLSVSTTHNERSRSISSKLSLPKTLRGKQLHSSQITVSLWRMNFTLMEIQQGFYSGFMADGGRSPCKENINSSQ
jgi:hypothetical protein